MSEKTKPSIAGRKICVPRRRIQRGKAESVGVKSDSVQSVPDSSHVSLPSHTTSQNIPASQSGSARQTSETGKAGQLFHMPGTGAEGVSLTGFIPINQPTVLAPSQVGGEDGRDTFTTDFSNATDAFSRVSLKEKTTTTLYEAVRLGNEDLLKELLVNKSGVSDQLDYALTTAVTKKSAKMAEILLKNGANPKYLDHCYPLLMTAADLNDSETVDVLLKHGADPNVGSLHGTALHSAMRFGSADLVRKLLDAGTEVERCGGLFSLLMQGMQTNNMDCVELILEKCTDVNATYQNQQTLLHLAAQFCKLDLIRRLIDRGADLMNIDKDGYLPWMLAVKRRRKQEADILFPSKDKVNSKLDKRERAPLHFACHAGMHQCVERLLREDADINIQDVDGSTPLMIAILENQTTCAKVLLKSPTLDLSISNNDGKTALYLAVQSFSSNINLVDKLYKSESDVHKFLPSKETLIQSVINDSDAVTWLINKGVNLRFVSSAGETALGKAVEAGAEKSVKLLLESGAPLSHLVLAGPAGTTPMDEVLNSSLKRSKFLAYAGCSHSYLSRWLNSAEYENHRESRPMTVVWFSSFVQQIPTLVELSRNALICHLDCKSIKNDKCDSPLPLKLKKLFNVDYFIDWKKKQYDSLDDEYADYELEDDSDDWGDYDEDSD